MKSTTIFQYEFERPSLATDCVIFGFDGEELKLLLLKREKEPFKDKWVLPGGFVFMHETTEECAKRILFEKAGVEEVFIEQLYTFSKVDRDPRERIISVAFFALVNTTQLNVIAGRDTVLAEWHTISTLPELGFDHAEMVSVAVERIKAKVHYQPIGFELLDAKFTLSQLQQLYEAILQTPIDKRNFRKKILGMGFLKQLDEKEKNVPRKAAFYYSFDKKSYVELTKKGFHFEL